MRKWKITLPGGQSFTMESDEPGQALINKGYTSFSMEEIIPPPPVPEGINVNPDGRLTLSVAEAAKELGICTKSAYNLIHRADFPTVRIGKRVRISRAGLAEWVRAQEQNRARA
ncbi:helix-turn-helix domain-containing protein [Flintibacter muris]|uniref:helix-turn-helix domain-containing protein n=1 Tax=Flintibacter muris TaxID=2941327 RepID=UPI002040C785|nr:helix-turn-helix domain-containing protein [Flintibacter muris]